MRKMARRCDATCKYLHDTRLIISNHTQATTTFLQFTPVLHYIPYPARVDFEIIAPMSSTQLDDGRVGSRIENYSGFWQKDINKEAQYGWSKSFHFSRFYKGEAFAASLARHEHYLSAQMSLRPGMRVLDVGCGVGGPAREIARFSDAKVVGLNNNDFQIGRARKYTKAAGLEDQVQFVKGDFMKLSEQFGENAFDAVYAIEATVHAPTWEGVYSEILKVLKPGGVFGVYEWCMTDRWDPSIPEHKALAHEIELAVGFQIEHEEDLAERPDPVPWYYPLEGDIFKAQTAWDYFTVWRMSWSGKLVTHNALRFLEFFGVVPKGTWEVGETLRVAGDALVKVARQR
ncbi:delta-sterol C-methyltransferase, partial [Russula brevipes]